LDGYDEISLTNDTKVITNNGEKIMTPEQLGKRMVNPTDIYGGNSVEEAAKIFTKILKGEGSWAQNAVVLANAAMALHCTGNFKTYDDAYGKAVDSLESGKAKMRPHQSDGYCRNCASYPGTLLLRRVSAMVLWMLLAGCLGFVPGRQSYWDAQVKELCAKDGGVVVYERVTLTPIEYARLRGASGGVVIPTRKSAPPGAPYVRETEETNIHRSNPEVLRRETRIIRTSDNKVVSRYVTYIRIGGDIPSPAHASSFACRDVGVREDIEAQTFVVPGGRV